MALWVKLQAEKRPTINTPKLGLRSMRLGEPRKHRNGLIRMF